MAIKKSFYQVLEIPAGASADAIRTAFEKQLGKLKAQESVLDFDEFEYRRKLLELAHATLADPASRREYDNSLMSRPLITQPVLEAEKTLARRAEALALRADAMALRADAISLTSNAALPAHEEPATLGSRVAGALKVSMRNVAILMVTLAATAFLFQSFFMVSTVRKAGEVSSAAAKAEEQIVIEEYFRQHGVRPASAAEARMLERESQRREREEREAERAIQRQEQETKRKEADDRQYAAQISADLHSAEARIAREEARAQQQKELEDQQREANEQRRIRQQEQEWRAIMRR